MEDSYKFLRYEFPGLGIFVYLWINLILSGYTIIPTFDLAAFFAAIALPIGYLLHQCAIRVRPEAFFFLNRDAYLLILNMMQGKDKWGALIDGFKKKQIEKHVEGQINDVLLSLMNGCYYRQNDFQNKADRINFSQIYENGIKNRWNHYYARIELGNWAPIISLVIWVIIISLSDSQIYLNGKLNLITGVVWNIFNILISHFLVAGSGARKIQDQINVFENLIVLNSIDFIKNQIILAQEKYGITVEDCLKCKNEPKKKKECKKCHGMGQKFILKIIQ